MVRMSRRKFVASTGAVAGAVGLGFTGPSHAQAKHGGTVIVAMTTGSPRHLNPAVQSGSATGVPGAQIFASPLLYDNAWNPKPYLARTWEIGGDGLSVRLDLIPDATFHDGMPITSADVAYSIMAIKKDHPFQTMFESVDEVETPDPHTAVIRLAQPHPAILLALSPPFCPILPKHIFDDGTDLKLHPANSKPVGSGPFKLVEFKPGEHIILERNAQFFIPDRPYLDRMIIRLIDDPNALNIAMERREINLMLFATAPRDIDRLSKAPHLAVTSEGYAGIGPLNWVAFNLRRPLLNDKRVRQAIAYAIDRQFITEKLLLGKAAIATGPISNSSPFYSSDVEHYSLNLERASKLLDEAGLKPGPDGTRFSLSIDYLPSASAVEQLKNVAEYLKPQLRKVGIDVQVRVSPDFPTWASRVSSGDFDMTMDLVFNWGDPLIGVHRTYLSSNIREGVIWSNTQSYSNAQVDSLLAQAAVETDFTKRKALYDEFQKIVVDDAPVTYINVSPYATIYDRGLAGIPTSIWGGNSPMDELHWEKLPG